MERDARAVAADLHTPILDVRTLEERQELGWIPGSIWVPAALWSEPSALVAALPEVADGAVLACATGRRSLTGAARLRERGFAAWSLTGGLLGWRAAGLPVSETMEPAPVISPERFWREVLSCFVAEVAETLDDEDEPALDPVEVVRQFLAPEERDPYRLRLGIDRLGNLARRQGHPLEHIAGNVSRFHAVIGQQRWPE